MESFTTSPETAGALLAGLLFVWVAAAVGLAGASVVANRLMDGVAFGFKEMVRGHARHPLAKLAYAASLGLAAYALLSLIVNAPGAV